MTRLQKTGATFLFGAGLLAASAGLCSVNPYWRVVNGMFPAAWDHWNGACVILGFISWVCMFAAMICAFAWTVFGILHRQPSRYMIISVVFLGIASSLFFLLAPALHGRLWAVFRWDSKSGFQKFAVAELNKRTGKLQKIQASRNLLVTIQTKPMIGTFLKNSSGELGGAVDITAGRIIPFAIPTALGSGGQIICPPDPPDHCASLDVP